MMIQRIHAKNLTGNMVFCGELQPNRPINHIVRPQTNVQPFGPQL